MAFSVQFCVDKNNGVNSLSKMLNASGVSISGVTDVPYAYKLACEYGTERFGVVLYYNGKGKCTKAVLEGKAGCIGEKLLAGVEITAEEPLQTGSFAKREIKDIPHFICHIGTDESGKGDYFGPLCACGVFVDERTEQILKELGARDSKLSTDKHNSELAKQFKQVLTANDYDIICISPQKYNELYAKCGNLNSLLGWAHARVIENLLKKHPECKNAIVDQFGGEWVIKRSLMKLGSEIDVMQTPKGERDIAVAAASVLAREKYLNEIAALSKTAGVDLPKGAGGAVDAAAKSLVTVLGRDALSGYAKLHFKNTDKLK